MLMTRRHILRNAAGGLALAGLSAPARAQVLPGIARIYCGFPAGGTVDATARRVADAWRGKLAESVIVENRVGAGGRLAVHAAKDQPADGRSILLSPDSMLTIYQSVFTKLGYDPAGDVVAVSPVCSYTFAFGVGPGVPESVKTLAQFIDWAKANPDKAQYASPAAGSMPHFLGDVFFRAAGMTPRHVPYRGSAQAIQDLLGGHVPSCLTVLGDFLPVRSQPGVRVLAVSHSTRSRFMPDVPTFTEQNFANVQGIEHFGIFLPKGAGVELVGRLNTLVREAVADPVMIEGLARIGMDPAPMAASAYAALLESERKAWGPIVKASGFSLEE